MMRTPTRARTTLVLTAVLLFGVCDAFAEAVDFERQAITVALTQEPPNLNSLETTDLVSFFVLGHVMEGLLRYDRRGLLAPGVAESWEVGEREVTFHLRADARWSDGTPVRAGDFLFAWRAIVDPSSAAPYAMIHYPILNAEAIHNGKMPLSSLGVRTPDSRTLVVTLERPCGYFLKLMTHAAFFPVPQQFFDAHRVDYAAEADRLLYNGPFKLTGWTHDASLAMVKNEQYWNRAEIQLREIRVGYITADNRARLNLFHDGRIALVRLDGDTVRDAANYGLKVRTFATGGVSFLRFNVRDGRVTHNRSIRRAIRDVFDPDNFVNRVIAIPGYKPAYSFFPSWVAGVDGKFLGEYPPDRTPVDSLTPAQEIAQARAELGVDRVPQLVMLTVASPTGMKIAEYFQGLLKSELGIDLKIDSQSFKQYLARSMAGDFDLLLSSWYPDFDDIMTYADLMATGNPNNRGGYSSPEYDRYLAIVKGAISQRERMDAAGELQKIIREDAMVLPMAETGSAYVQHPKLRGVVRRVLGADPDYTYAHVIE